MSPKPVSNLKNRIVDLVHPASWWLLGLALAVAAGLSGSWVVENALILVSLTLIWLLANRSTNGLALRFYLWMALFVVVVRVGFRLLFGSAGGLDATGESDVLINLPTLILNLGFGEPIQFLGPIHASGLLAGLTDGLRLAAIILAVGMANSLANPRRLLKATPAALFEIATTVAIAVNLAPQLIESLQRVRRARSLRGRSKGVRVFASIVVPVLEDAIERSLLLAASMDSRGFGRTAQQSNLKQTASRLLSLFGVVAIAIGSFVLLTSNSNAVLAGVVLALGVCCIAATVRIASQTNIRTQYRRQKLGASDFALWLLAAAVVVLVIQVGAIAS